jgi:ketosteroid isomerase-like protein
MLTEAQQDILDLQRQVVWSALKAKDVVAWEGILADDFVYRSPGESDEDKSGFIRRITSFPATVLSITSEDLRVDVFADAAIVTGVQCAVIRLPSGFQIEDFTMLNNVFVKRDGQWRLALSHAMNLPA